MRRTNVGMLAALASMGAMAATVRADEKMRVSPISFGGIRTPPRSHGFVGLGKGRPTPSKRRPMNVKHAKRRARIARRDR